ncbi:MAG: DUF192 domain-containing protein [Candidatus Portnoybacteria bacterium]|nr:DUF192 domain-containing protein [Candidatus Portnoybacteria bacterium]
MRKLILLLILLVLTAAVSFWLLGIENDKTLVIFSQAKTRASIAVKFADDPRERARGLSGRDSLDQNQGMLFIFEKPDLYGFWMKDMKFPLDFIWISGNKITDLSENIPYPRENSYLNLPKYQPKEPVDKVLEINAGLVEKYGIKIGDEILY